MRENNKGFNFLLILVYVFVLVFGFDKIVVILEDMLLIVVMLVNDVVYILYNYILNNIGYF